VLRVLHDVNKKNFKKDSFFLKNAKIEVSFDHGDAQMFII